MKISSEEQFYRVPTASFLIHNHQNLMQVIVSKSAVEYSTVQRTTALYSTP